MEHYVYEGVILKISDTQVFKNNFKKREIVLVSDGAYPEEIKFEFADENGINSLDKFLEGERVKIAFLIKGNSYEGKHYVNLRAIAIASVEEESKGKKNKKGKNTIKIEKVSEDDGTLPF